jgi:hypothetical protein
MQELFANFMSVHRQESEMKQKAQEAKQQEQQADAE